MTKQPSNILQDVQQQVCDMLNDNQYLSGQIEFLAENRRDIDFEIEKALKKQGICGLVMTPKASFAGKYSDHNLVWQLDELTVQIVENVPVARAIHSKLNLTGQDASMLVMDVLGKEHYGQFSPVSYEQGEDNSLLVNKCVFKCLVQPEIEEPEPIDKGVSFKNVSDQNGRFSILRVGTLDGYVLTYSTDEGQNWNDYELGTAITVPSQGSVCLKAKELYTNFDEDNHIRFEFDSGSFEAEGSVMYLIDPTGQLDEVPDYAFKSLFALGAGSRCLSKAPELTATKVGKYSYESMFSQQYLDYPVVLPATQLDEHSYENMFFRTKCPKVTILAEDIGHRNCMSYMFDSGLVYDVEVNFTDWASETYPTSGWFMDIRGAEGTFTCPAGLPEVRGESRIPNNFTIVRK